MTAPDHSRFPPAPTWLEINLGAVRRNTAAVLRHTGQPLMAVVKADAYGLGAAAISRAALEAGAAWLAVARCSEGLELRRAGIQAPILVFGMAVPAEVDAALANNLTLTLYNRESADLIAQRAAALGLTARVHLKVDTGFGRMGALPAQALDLAGYAQCLGGIQLDGLYSHLAMADEAPDHPLTRQQIERFTGVLAALRAAGHDPRWVHLSNSAAAFLLPEAHFNLVRTGSALIGLLPAYFLPLPAELERAVTWKALIADTKALPGGWAVGYGQTERPEPGEAIGVLSVGYGDGFRRAPGNVVLVHGRRIPVIGRVSSDLTTLRLPPGFPPAREAVLIGRQGQEAIYAEELAKRWGCSQSAVLSGISPRVPRVYLEE